MKKAKQLLYIAGILLFSSMVLAAPSQRTPAQKEYIFKYNLNNAKFEVKRTDSTYELAYEFAAKQCFSYYSKRTQLTESKGLEIIDICANPRS